MNHKLDTDIRAPRPDTQEHWSREDKGLWIHGSPGMAIGTVMAAFDVLKERRRQTQEEGWTPAHDDEHTDGELAIAAACYALHGGGPVNAPQGDVPEQWPFEEAAWKPKDERRTLVIAGALILAEIERIDRAAAKPAGALK